MSHGSPRRGPRGSVVFLVILTVAGWACATSDNVEPDPAGAGGNNGTAGTTGAAGDSGGPGSGGTTGAAGNASAAGNSGAAGSSGTTGAGGTTAGTSGARGGAGGTAAGTSGARGGAGGTAGTSGGAGGTTAGTSGARGGAGGAAGTSARGGAGGTAGASGARGGAGGTAGTSAARGGTTGSGGTGTGGAPSSTLCTWPTANGSQSVSSTINVSGTYDGGMKRFTGSGALGGGGQNEGQPAMFQIANGGTLTNVIIGNPAADGVHCSGSCTLRNVWWEDVGEDAATLTGSSSSQVMTIDTGGAKAATDKVFQHNGPGTMIIRNFCAQDFGKLYRSCGNCSTQYTRHVEFDNVMIMPKIGPLAGVNANYNDTAKFSRIIVRASSGTICDRYNGNNTGAEPTKIGSGADGVNCIYSASDITYMP